MMKSVIQAPEIRGIPRGVATAKRAQPESNIRRSIDSEIQTAFDPFEP